MAVPTKRELMYKKFVWEGDATQSTPCVDCVRYIGDQTCKAFPKGIPAEIQSGQHQHRMPYPNDKGLQYKEEK